MMKYFKTNVLVTIFLGALFLVSCSTDDPAPEIPTGSEGYFIVNEGGFGNGNTSISFYDRETGEVSNNIFSIANGIPLGDQAQSMTVHDGKGFIVVQGSAKIEVIDEDDFTIISTISEGIVSPRYFVGLSSSKGYVSDWGADGVTGTVKVLDLTTYEVTKTISTGQGTNRLLLIGTSLYAVNAGGWGRDNTVKVIDTAKDEVTSTITIADNPGSLQRDSDGNIWVATKGHTQFNANFEIVPEESTAGALIKLSAGGTELTRLSFESGGPSSLNTNATGTQLYYNYSGAIYSISTSATTLPTSSFIDKNFYGFAVDPIDDTIIGCEAPDFSSAGNILIYNSEGSLISTTAVGIGPNGCTFK